MKKTLIGVIILVTLLSFCGCTKGAENKGDIDIGSLANQIVETAKLSNGVFLVESEIALKMYDIEDDIQIITYASSGSSAEEVSVFKAENVTDANTVMEKVQRRVADRQEEYKDYMPEQVSKLENAIIEQRDIYVFLCISSSSDDVKELISSYID